ncbi:MAG TPA: hypothetical protein VFQ85_08230 [Mycobacteriales bacterium]|jgi:hypothetical protein|nr:hypothetical protein [Mycobacteriales bacterium]
MRVARVVLVASTAAGTLLTAHGAHADTDPLPQVERPHMWFTASFTTSGQTICGNGELRVPPTTGPLWTIEFTGARSNGTAINYTTSTATQPTAQVCWTVPKNGADTGSYDVLFTYRSDVDPPTPISAIFKWQPGSEGIVVGYSM